MFDGTNVVAATVDTFVVSGGVGSVVFGRAVIVIGVGAGVIGDTVAVVVGAGVLGDIDAPVVVGAGVGAGVGF